MLNNTNKYDIDTPVFKSDTNVEITKATPIKDIENIKNIPNSNMKLESRKNSNWKAYPSNIVYKDTKLPNITPSIIQLNQ